MSRNRQQKPAPVASDWCSFLSLQKEITVAKKSSRQFVPWWLFSHCSGGGRLRWAVTSPLLGSKGMAFPLWLSCHGHVKGGGALITIAVAWFQQQRSCHLALPTQVYVSCNSEWRLPRWKQSAGVILSECWNPVFLLLVLCLPCPSVTLSALFSQIPPCASRVRPRHETGLQRAGGAIWKVGLGARCTFVNPLATLHVLLPRSPQPQPHLMGKVLDAGQKKEKKITPQ